ncbi:MAG: biopolymer transporter ExbD [Kiritimatiellae bacterium]|nr:biopolymer transporter ExbD [Kiritimatiellia bacterium]
MAKKNQHNPQLDMTPMIDVVFELIIFFVVTLVEAQRKDESIELEDGRHGIVLTPEELPPTHMMIDIGLRKGKPRISMGDRDISPEEIGRRVKDKMRRVGEFSVLIRADYAVPHYAVARVMNACTAAGIWKISFVAVQEDKTYKDDAGLRAKLRKINEGITVKGGPRARLLTKFPNQKPKKGK